MSIIGELAPLLSVLGHQMHKRHKSACTPDLDACPDWDVRGRVICPFRFTPARSIFKWVLNFDLNVLAGFEV